MAVICHYCNSDAELVDGDIIYRSRRDLASLKFWRCAACDAYVGCHRRGAKVDGEVSDGTMPLGWLANRELRQLRQRAHHAFDSIWRNDHMTRNASYEWLAKELRIPKNSCHIAQFDVAECNAVIAAVERFLK